MSMLGMHNKKEISHICRNPYALYKKGQNNYTIASSC